MKNFNKNDYDFIIIGGGASGLFCSATFPYKTKGLILEKGKQPGTKLLMSGSGQCNITHSGSIKEFVNCYGKNGVKIRSCLYKNSNTALVDFLNINNIDTIIREDGKIFPKSLKASTILELLLQKTNANGFEIRTNNNVLDITKSGTGFEVHTIDEIYFTKKLIISTGGCSYPTTGSDGSMLKTLENSFGLEIIDPKPALVPIFVENYCYGDLSGISFKGVKISLNHNEKKLASEVGDLLITHTNFSGPAIINISRFATVGDKLLINYVYPYDYKYILEKITKLAANTKTNPSKLLSTELNLPKRFLDALTDGKVIKPKILANNLTEQCFTISGTSGFKSAMTTAGGIDLEQINLKTMECNNIPGLYIIGEALDIDGNTGGYNLQFAYSSAKAANNNFK